MHLAAFGAIAVVSAASFVALEPPIAVIAGGLTILAIVLGFLWRAFKKLGEINHVVQKELNHNSGASTKDMVVAQGERQDRIETVVDRMAILQREEMTAAAYHRGSVNARLDSFAASLAALTTSNTHAA